MDTTETRGYHFGMSIHTHGIYKAGAIHFDQPLALPDNTKVELVISPTAERPVAASANRPAAPQITPQELRALVRQHAGFAKSLPVDFSRDDIYPDDE